MELKSVQFVAKKLNLQEQQVQVTLDLLAEGATIPFIARYRKNATNGLNEEQIAQINDFYVYDVELNKRKEAIINILKERGLLTEEIENKIKSVETKSELENIYEPFKIGKKTKATEAIALGLEPLAKTIMEANDDKFNPYKEAQRYLNDKVTTVDFAIEQSKFIISQIMSQDIETRNYVKEQFLNFGTIITSLKKNAIDEKENFKQYYEFKERVNHIPNYRILAIARGENLKILNYDIETNLKKITYDLNAKYFKIKTTGTIILDSLKDALDRLIIPSIIREIKTDLFERAEKEAIKLFAENLEAMLLFPAVKNKRILAIDPAYVNGCKIVALDASGNLLDKNIIFPNPPKNQTEKAKIIVNNLLDKYHSDIIVIGNGTASRETEKFIASIIEERKQTKNENISYAVVSEIGASVYSASDIAIKEFPDLDVQERSAINIGRKYQDPLNELIKIDPKSIGVGQYQHDVNQKELSKQLQYKVDKVVNLVGVDLNTATEEILKYISGLSTTMAKNILQYRLENKFFKTREELKKVKGLGQKAYEQAVGFLRIHNSKNFFDKTQIHPESYELAKKIIEHIELDLTDIDQKLLEKQNIQELAKQFNSNEYDVKLIIDSLKNPGKDIRDSKDGYILRKDVLTIEDLKVDEIYEGSVLNITDFGIFVYIGIKESVLIHISNLKRDKNHYIKHPSEIVKTGQNIKLKIISIDPEHKKIQGKLFYE
ncbi:Tex-like N-terminal domain-containing protein [Mycoplasmopsis hyopharyngis]|uniref:Tex-like N-terminal domain-containing protein n=1 Tax=Mycoplasmopsis hyopharyngis TaxID=29558 RepID=UPI003873BFA4